jgi:hypothetical protein
MSSRIKKTGSAGEVFKFATVGDSLQGYFVGSEEGTGEFGPHTKYLFKTDSGVKVVFGSKGLNDILEGENPGPFVTITYVGTKESKKRGRQPMKMFEADWDDENMLPDAEIDSANEDASSSEEYYTDDFDTPADEVVTAPVRTKPKAMLPSAAAQASVQAMLSSKKRA